MKALKFLGLCGLAFIMASCGNSASKEKEAEEAQAAEETFQAEQPVESGVYDATYFDIKGKENRKGQFDGRVIFSLSPDQNAIFVYENGNRTKIKHILMLDKPFEKQDSVYVAMDKTGIPVTVGSDSTSMYVDYVAKGDTVTVTFDKKPRNVYTPLEALEKIKEQSSK